MRFIDRLIGKSTRTTRRLKKTSILFVDAENSRADPEQCINEVESHAGMRLSMRIAYSKWSARSLQVKKYRNAGFRLVQADSGQNNADIMLATDALYEVMERACRDEGGTIYVNFYGDKGFTHLFDHIRKVNNWRSVWVTSNSKPSKMISNAADEVLIIGATTKLQPSVMPKSITKPVVKPKSVIVSGTQILNSEETTLASKITQIARLIQSESTTKDMLHTWFGLRFSAHLREIGIPNREELNVRLGLKRKAKLSELLEHILGDDVIIQSVSQTVYSIEIIDNLKPTANSKHGSAAKPKPVIKQREELQHKVEQITRDIILSSEKRPANRSWFISKLKDEINELGFKTLSELKQQLGHPINAPHSTWLKGIQVSADGMDYIIGEKGNQVISTVKVAGKPSTNEAAAIELLRGAVQSIVTEPMKVISFNTKLKALLDKHGELLTKPKDLYTTCGAPKSWTTLQVLERFAPNIVSFKGKGNNAILKPRSR